jgi:acyl-CoA synthetase (AMP-forming)/AMP-acid ligase II
MTVEDRYLWTLPMFHANGWTFVWSVTAAGGRHVCLRRVEPAGVFDAIARESVTMLCAAPTVLIGIAGAPEELRRGARRGVRVVTAGAPPAAATIQRVEDELGWTITQVYRDPEATAEAMRGGWFHSGDAAVVHPDGYVEIRDRFKDVIISGGENVSSVEVEGVLLRHPEVHEAAVVGLPHAKWGEAPHAFVVRRAGAALTEEELRCFAGERLAGFKTPKGITFVDELPKTATGKVQKFVQRGGRPAISRQ